MKTGAVIAAAGVSSRMEDFKPLMQIGNMSIISRIIATFQQAGIFPIAVVTGYRAGEIEKHLSRLGVICVRNPQYAVTDMTESAKLGFAFMKGKCDRVFFTPGDIPFFNYDTVRQLLATEADVAKPRCQGRGGHPILLRTEFMERLLLDSGTGGLKQAIIRQKGTTAFVEVRDEGILWDADTREEFDRLIAFHNRRLLRPVLDIAIMQEGPVFDKEAALLLQLVAYTGAVKEASERMGISYSKAWKRIAALERNLGYPLLERQTGGEAGGMSCLTARGEELLRQYGQYAEAVRKFANDAFETYFGKNPTI